MAQKKREDGRNKANLMELSRMMDGFELFLNYEDLCSAALLYRDRFVMKLLKKIAGKEGDINAVMYRWYNTSDFFKEYRTDRDNWIKSFFFWSLRMALILLFSGKCVPKKREKQSGTKWKEVHADALETERINNNNIAFFVFSFYRPSCNFGAESFFCF
jgi:hypothetical protein